MLDIHNNKTGQIHQTSSEYINYFDTCIKVPKCVNQYVACMKKYEIIKPRGDMTISGNICIILSVVTSVTLNKT